MKTWFKRILTAGAMTLALGTAGLGLSTHAVAQDKPAAEASAATASATPAAAVAALRQLRRPRLPRRPPKLPPRRLPRCPTRATRPGCWSPPHS